MIDNSNLESCNALFSAVGCVCFQNNMFLLLKRGKDKSYPNHWGIPTGKIEKNETPLKAVVRELFEETRIILSSERLKNVDTFCVTNEEMSFKYTLYYTEFDSVPDIKLNPLEHTEYQWMEVDSFENLRLVPDVRETILFTLKKRNRKGSAQINLFTNEPDNIFKTNVKLEEYLKEFSGLEKRFDLKKNWMVSLGSPGSGKSTSLKALHKANNNYHLISDNSKILKKDTRLKRYFNEAMRNKKFLYFFYFQMEILPEKFKQSFNCPNNSLVDETIFSTLAYSTALHRLSWMSKEQYETFLNNYQFYLNFLPTPSEIFYFYCNTKTLFKRIKDRDRKIEHFFTNEYVEALNKGFEDVAIELEKVGYRVTYINTDNYKTDQIVDLLQPKLLSQWI